MRTRHQLQIYNLHHGDNDNDSSLVQPLLIWKSSLRNQILLMNARVMDSVKDNGASSNPKPSSIMTNGAVSGVLPQAEAFVVNYPGYPSSPSRAIDTLGGLHEIAKVRCSDSGQLELQFRPEDPHCHPAFGERRTFSGLLLKLSQTRPESDDNGKLSAEIAARVNEAYNFEGMVDYQHVPAVHAAEARRKRQRCVFEEDDLDTEEDVMMLLPPLFSLKNIPEEIVLIPPPNLFSKNLQKSVVEHRWEMDIEPCLAIDFNIESVPKKVNWEDNIPRDTTEWEWQSAVSKLFEERPIWPRRSIHEQLVDNGVQVTDHTLRRFLFRSGYYFATGPFGRFWIKKGYDPRKDPESRKYQRVDFRVPSQLRNGSDAVAGHRLKQTWNNICRFQVFPGRNFTSLQLFELDDDFIRAEIEQPTNQTTCTRTRGWFSDTRLKTLRLRVSMRFLSICPNESAEIILRSISEEFERSKKLEALSRIRKPVLKLQYFNQDSDMSMDVVCAESSDTEDQLLDQNEPNNCEIENDGKEEEEEEEELDGYESPNVAVEDGCFSLETGSYKVGDNMPNNYLQDILSEFPFCNDGRDSRSDKEAHGADLSDGEYHIYEQDSDEDDNGDDDFNFT